MTRHNWLTASFLDPLDPRGSFCFSLFFFISLFHFPFLAPLDSVFNKGVHTGCSQKDQLNFHQLPATEKLWASVKFLFSQYWGVSFKRSVIITVIKRTHATAVKAAWDKSQQRVQNDNEKTKRQPCDDVLWQSSNDDVVWQDPCVPRYWEAGCWHRSHNVMDYSAQLGVGVYVCLLTARFIPRSRLVGCAVTSFKNQ